IDSKIGNGMTFGAVFTATCIASAFSTIIMAFFANLPVALAPGMGLNAFFTFTVCGQMGCSWQFALTAVFVEGLIFIILSLFGVREKIIDAIPETMKKSVAVGIGLFICLIGLTNAGIATSNFSNGGTIIEFVTLNLSNKTALVAVIGLILTIVLYLLNVPGAILIGIILTTVIGIPFRVTTIPEGWSPVSIPEAPLLFRFEWKSILSVKFFVVMFTFLFTDLFDTLGTLMGVTQQAGLVADGKIPNAKQALMADSVGTVVGACLGTSTVTSYVESSSGVAAGGRTGLASLVTGVLFLISLFFTNLFALIPSCATAPALIFVGFLMLKQINEINFTDPTDGIPAFITIVVMPFAYSISKGIAFGMIVYVIAKCAGKKAKEIPVATWVLAGIFIADLIFEAVK
ncbi:MAG: NCS2 family permease, partial [Treponema sp.]|nr:NCS2 family permease [Treponema sp.]